MKRGRGPPSLAATSREEEEEEESRQGQESKVHGGSFQGTYPTEVTCQWRRLRTFSPLNMEDCSRGGKRNLTPLQLFSFFLQTVSTHTFSRTHTHAHAIAFSGAKTFDSCTSAESLAVFRALCAASEATLRSTRELETAAARQVDSSDLDRRHKGGRLGGFKPDTNRLVQHCSKKQKTCCLK